jgi:NADPH-dependent curcumin reductase CurA
LDLVLKRMKKFGRIAACGAVSDYNKGGNPIGIKNWFEVISNRLEIRGFIVIDAFARSSELMGVLIKGYKEGKIHLDESSETIIETKFEDVPKTWWMLYEGKNQGKLITKLVQ